MAPKLEHLIDKEGGHHGWAAWCPGCRQVHVFDARWTFDGNQEAPTFEPSLLVNGHGRGVRCHSFLRAGVWEFQTDCDHQLKGQRISLPDFRWSDDE